MTKEKCRNLLKQSYPENKTLKTAEKFNIFLADHKIIKKEDKIQITTDEYKKYFIEKLSKGKFISYNFTNELYEIVEGLIKKRTTNSILNKLKISFRLKFKPQLYSQLSQIIVKCHAKKEHKCPTPKKI